MCDVLLAIIFDPKVIHYQWKLKGRVWCRHIPGVMGTGLYPKLSLQFSLVVDDFGIKYDRQEDITHLLDALNTIYKISEDWYGKLYCGLNLNWNYYKRDVMVSMPNYVTKALHKFHIPPQGVPNMHPINGRAQIMVQQNNSQLPWILHRQSQRNGIAGSVRRLP